MTKAATKAEAARQAAFAKIAEEHLYIETLETRNMDSDDFSEVAVWAVKAALEAAYKLGQEAAAKAN